MDADSDAKVTKEEFLAFHSRHLGLLFASLDKDKNGTLDEREIAVTVRRVPAPGQSPAGRPGVRVPAGVSRIVRPPVTRPQMPPVPVKPAEQKEAK